MRRWLTVMVAALAVLGAAGATRAADPWEGGGGDDDPLQAAIDNALGHGSVQTHDLQAQGGVPDVDWIRIPQLKGHSYEVRLGSASVPVGTVCTGCARFQRVRGDGAVLQNGNEVPYAGADPASNERSLRWIAEEDTTDEYVRITASTNFDATSVYTVRYWDTTLVAAGTAPSSFSFHVFEWVVSNLTPTTASVQFFGYLASTRQPQAMGATVTLQGFATRRGSVPDLAMFQSGTWFIAHTAGYGGLAARIHPDGMALDTMFQPIPH